MPTIDERPRYYVRHSENCDDVDGAYTSRREAERSCRDIVRATGEAHYVVRSLSDEEDEVVYAKEPSCR